nr:reverse transcriptase domain-containing protein [Tanacetum cinerariifolium]
MIDQGVNATLPARDANQTGDDSHTSRTGVRRTERVTRECTYQDFMKCQPLYFKETEGVVELTQWFERMETVFCISNCLAENQEPEKCQCCQQSTTTTTVTNAQLQAMIDQGVNAVLAARDTNRTGDESHTSGTGVRRTERVTRECTYHDFMKCQPLYFKGTEGVVKLTQWFERMEMVFLISNCLAENQVKFATCTLLAGALTWWNSHVRIVGNDAAYVMTWIELKKKMTDKYNQHFQELALLCVRTCPEESDRVERYIGGFPDSIHGSVAASKPKTMQEATEMATGLMDKKIRTYAERQAANKRKFKDTSRNNQGRQQPPKRQDVARAYAAGSGNRKQYKGPRPLINPDANTVTGTFLLNNCYAFVLFDTGADRSFVSTAFSSQFDIAPTVLDHDYVVELADSRIVSVNTVIRSCILNFLNHPFNINLMPVEMGSFDVIIDMDWLSRYLAIIVCADKIVRIPWGRETLIFHGDGSNQEHKARLNIISCAKMQKYMLKGCQVFLAHVTTKEAEGKSEKKRIENVPIV